MSPELRPMRQQKLPGLQDIANDATQAYLAARELVQDLKIEAYLNACEEGDRKLDAALVRLRDLGDLALYEELRARQAARRERNAAMRARQLARKGGGGTA